MRCLVFIVLVCLVPHGVWANDRLVQLYAPAKLIETGLLKHILPRFSLKTQVRIELVDEPSAAQVILGPEGRAIFDGAGETWHIQVRMEHRGTDRLVEWLGSAVGQKTIFGFAPDGVALFAPPQEKEVEVVEVALDGDAELGREISQAKCGRCHTVVRDGRISGIGSTPSFFVLRSLEDWDVRFSSFYVLNPHPAFTQVKDVTEPFPINRPSPIAPIEMTLDEVEAVLAYVGALAAADLGAPIEHQ